MREEIEKQICELEAKIQEKSVAINILKNAKQNLIKKLHEKRFYAPEKEGEEFSFINSALNKSTAVFNENLRSKGFSKINCFEKDEDLSYLTDITKVNFELFKIACELEPNRRGKFIRGVINFYISVDSIGIKPHNTANSFKGQIFFSSFVHAQEAINMMSEETKNILKKWSK